MDPAEAAVTIIIPCFNEEAGLPSLLDRLRALRANGWSDDWRVLFIDDGSTDRTFARLLQAAREEPWVEVVRHPENLGLGAALRTGFLYASSPIVCTLDSDCTYPPERLPELANLIRQGGDIATASTWHPDSGGAAGGRIRLLLSRSVSRLYKILIGQDVYTFTCLFRVYRRGALEKIRFRSNGFSAVAEIMLRGLLSGAVVRELPMALEPRRFGQSKLRVSDAIFAHVYLLAFTGAAVVRRRVRAIFTQKSFDQKEGTSCA